MAIERDEYKFPDEVETEKSQLNQEDSSDIQIEIEDDTPPEDRGRKPLPKNLVEELENDDLEEYSDKVKKRLSQMKKVWHDERREKNVPNGKKMRLCALLRPVNRKLSTLNNVLAAMSKPLLRRPKGLLIPI